MPPRKNLPVRGKVDLLERPRGKLQERGSQSTAGGKGQRRGGGAKAAEKL